MLRKQQTEDYHRKGYALVRGLFSGDEVSRWEAESRRLLRNGFGADREARTTVYKGRSGIRVIDRLHPVIDLSCIFKQLVEDKRILESIRALGGKEVLLFKDKIIYKMPGVPGYPIHQDYSSWQSFPCSMINVIVSIDGADNENGAVEFFAGYHDRLLSAPGEIRHMTEKEAEQIDFRTAELVLTEPGDLLFFHCLTPHRSGVNNSHRLRRQLYLTYSAASDGDLYQAQLEFMAQLHRDNTPINQPNGVHVQT